MTHPFPCSQLFPTWTGSRVRTTPFQSGSCSKETAQIRLQRLGGVPGKSRMTEGEEAGLRGPAGHSHHSIRPSRLRTAACDLVTPSGDGTSGGRRGLGEGKYLLLAPLGPALGQEDPLDRGAWWAVVHGVLESGTQLKQVTHAWDLRPLLRSAHSAPSQGLSLSAPDARWPVEGAVCKPMALFSVCPMQRKALGGSCHGDCRPVLIGGRVSGLG